MIKHRANIIKLGACFALLTALFLFSPRQAHAVCWPNQCPEGVQKMSEKHREYVEDIIVDNDSGVGGEEAFVPQLKAFQRWLVPDIPVPVENEGFIIGHPIRAMRLMTRQLTVFAMQQIMIVGNFIDAAQQMETIRQHQILKTEAHRDYTPSEDFCWFGTNVRSMAQTEARGRFNSLALNQALMNRHLGKKGTSAATGIAQDRKTRWNKFTTTYCNPKDNAWNSEENTGLEKACGTDGGGESERINIDIDYTRLVDQKRTLDVSFDNTEDTPPIDREDVIALAHNLYGHKALSRNFKETDFKAKASKEKFSQLYMKLRSVAAKRNVAENSFNAIVELKSAGGQEDGESSSARTFLGAILAELGMPKDEIFQYIGANPSYYAQLELLAKKIYQNPDFFVNLYDKPVNVQRKAAALKAIELLLDRAIYESQLRREMATSVLLSTKLRDKYKDKNEQLAGAGG